MSADEPAGVEARIDLYTTIWTLFRDRPFEADELARRLIERGEHGALSADGEPDASLSWLVDAGVLTTDSAGYRVTIEPNAAAEALAETGPSDVEAVRQQVFASLTATDADADPQTLFLDDGHYVVVELGVGESVDAAAERVVDAAAAAEGRGVVVTTPGTNAGVAQQLADRLVADRPWSKAGSTVVEGDHEDAELVFRLYLDTANSSV